MKMENEEKKLKNILSEAKNRKRKENAIARMTKANEDKSNITISDAIRNIRVSKNLTQLELAEKLGMSQNGYSKIERGYTLLTLPRIKEIAKVLDVNYAELLSQVEGFEEEKEEFETVKINEEIRQVKLKYLKRIKEISRQHAREEQLLRQNLKEKDKVIQLLEDKIKLLESR